MRKSSPQRPWQSAGIALVSALIFLLILTLLAVAVASLNSASERMAYAAASYSRTFQAADSAVREGETWIQSQTAPPTATTSCTNCTTPPMTWDVDQTFAATDTSPANWNNFPWTTAARQFSENYQADGTATARADASLPSTGGSSTPLSPPYYVIEKLGTDPKYSRRIGNEKIYAPYYYRITARAQGNNTPTATYAQSVYAKQF